MLRTLFYLFVLAAVCFGGELQTVKEPDGPITKRVMLVLDVSGSMVTQKKIPESLSCLKTIAEQPIDEMELAVLIFSDETKRWDGIPDEDAKIPKGWAALPSEEAVKAAQDFVTTNVMNNNTRYLSALQAALSEPRDQLTIVLITDGIGIYAFDQQITLTKVQELQEWRVQEGYGKAVIYAINIGRLQDWLTELVKLGGGGHYRVE